MVFLHGGRHMVGGALGGQISFDGARLAEEARVVVFSIELRFGLLGYLTHPALDAYADSGRWGKYGMLDELLGCSGHGRTRGLSAARRARHGLRPIVRLHGHRAVARRSARPRPVSSGYPGQRARRRSGRLSRTGARGRPEGRSAAVCNGPEAASCLRTVSTEQLRNPPPTPASSSRLMWTERSSRWRRSKPSPQEPTLTCPSFWARPVTSRPISARTCPMRNASGHDARGIPKVAEQALALTPTARMDSQGA